MVYIPTRVPLRMGDLEIYTHQGASRSGEERELYPPGCLSGWERENYTHQGASQGGRKENYTHQGASLGVKEGERYPPGCL